MGVVEVGVNLCRENILVTEQLLHLAYVGTSFEQVRGKGVAEGVGTYLLIDACTLCRLLYYSEYHYSGELLATIIQE